MSQWGYLRETKEDAIKAGIDKETGLGRTGLDEYLYYIFPKTRDWIHDKKVEYLKSAYRPDYRSESLKLIIEFDGIQHYTNPEQILRDQKKKEFFEKEGFKVVRIPYFIQLTKTAVKTLFNVDLKEELFDSSKPSLTIKSACTSAWLCKAGIERMAKEFKKFPDQYEVNINYLKHLNNEYLTGVSLLEEVYNK